MSYFSSHASINKKIREMKMKRNINIDLAVLASHDTEISGRSIGNHHGTIYQITNISKTAMIDALLLGIKKALFILLRMGLKQCQGN